MGGEAEVDLCIGGISNTLKPVHEPFEDIIHILSPLFHERKKERKKKLMGWREI